MSERAIVGQSIDQLYYAPGAASMLVHWLLIECGHPHALVPVDTAAGAQKRPGYLALNPAGVVPTLVLDGVPMAEAAALAMTLADRHPQAGLAPAFDDPRRPRYTQWMFHLANAVQPLFRIWWYPHEPAGADNAGLVREHVRPRIEAAWERIDAQLAASGPYLLGDSATAADFYLAMLMRWSRNMPRPATDWPQLKALAGRMKARPSYAALCTAENLEDWT
jgi:glutathione S-transferase